MDNDTTADIRFTISKALDEQQLVIGWAAVVTKSNGERIVDLQGDVISIVEIEKAAHRAMSFGGRGKGGEQHENMGIGDIVESFVVSKERREALGFGEGPEGWIVALKIHDPKVWAKVKSGEYSELSFRGPARARQV